MDVVLLLALAVILAGLVYLARRSRTAETELKHRLHLMHVELAQVSGRQLQLADDYREVHKILQQIRDLNTEELRDRKEILQHQNLTASNRVLQTRRHMAELEEAARLELEGLRRG